MPSATLTAMSKTLVIAEKPSVGTDLARVLKGPFKKGEGVLEGPEHVITWAVGHLVQLAEPDEYDPKFKRWRMDDLPIVPDRFKLVVRDERSRKQMSVVTKQIGRDDIDEVVNACDAGREGELIFAYLYEKAKGKKPVKRLWLNSMTSAAMKEAFAALRPADEFARLEQAARSRSEADWIVGMNATRAATIRLRSSFDGAVSLGRVQTPTLAIIARREEEIKAFVPEPYWLVDATFEPPTSAASAVYEALSAYRRRAPSRASPPRRRPRRSSPRARASPARSPSSRRKSSARKRRCSTTSRRCSARPTTATASPPNARSARRSACYEEHKALTYPRTNSRYLTSDMVAEIKPIAELVGAQRGVPQGRRVRRPASTCCRWRASSTTRRSPTTTRSSRRAPSTTSRK